MKCYNLKAIFGMAFGMILFVPTMYCCDPDIVCSDACNELVNYIDNSSCRDPKALMVKVVTCLENNPKYQQAAATLRKAATANLMSAKGLIDQAFSQLPSTPAVNLLRSKINSLPPQKQMALGLRLRSALR